MCLAIPGRIIELSETNALVDFGGNRVRVAATFTPEARCGDWVLVHAGFAIGVIDEAEALATWTYLQVHHDVDDREIAEDARHEADQAAAARGIGAES